MKKRRKLSAEGKEAWRLFLLATDGLGISYRKLARDVRGVSYAPCQYCKEARRRNMKMLADFEEAEKIGYKMRGVK